MTRAEIVTGELKRVSNRAWREVVARVPPVGRAVDRRYGRRLRASREQLHAPLPPRQRRLLDDVARNGIAITDLDTLGLSGTASLKQPLERLAAGLAERNPSTEPYPLCSNRAELLDEIG